MKSGRKAAGNPAEQSEIGGIPSKCSQNVIWISGSSFFLRADTIKDPCFPEFLYKK